MTVNFNGTSTNGIYSNGSYEVTNPYNAKKSNSNSKLNTLNSDTVKLSKKSANRQVFSESIIKEKSDFLGKTSTYTGNLNGKITDLESKQEGIRLLTFSTQNITGTIGDSEVNVHKQGSNYTGKLNDTEFNLEIKTSGIFNKKSKIVGTIGSQEVSFNLSSSEIPQDSDTQDILATVLILDGKKAKTKNGNFVGTEASKWYIKEQNDLATAAMMADSMYSSTTPTYTPTWHYDNPTMPTYY